jgi:nitrite reductase/ring-hydroxylating ferredoxin subunit
MAFFRRLFCVTMTPQPQQEDCWTVTAQEVRINLGQAAELAEPGGALRLEGKGLPNRLLVVHGIDDKFYAYKNNCACSGWRVDPVPGEARIRCCTLGQSTYDYSGQPVAGPAEKNLTTYGVEREGDQLVITLAGPSQ